MSTGQIITVVAIGLLIVLSGFFSGSETAVTAASRARLHHLEKQGNRRARMISELMRQRERFIGAILLGNNAVNILATALATSLLISVAGDAGVFYATIGLTLIILIFAEVLPKTYAIRNADRVALAVAPLLLGLVWLLLPAVMAVRGVVYVALMPFGAHKANGNTEEEGEEELRGAISLQAEEGVVVKHEHDMLHGILDLDDVAVGEIMTHRNNMAMIDIGDGVRSILDQMIESPYTRIPLWRSEPDNIIGIVHSKDLLRAIQGHRENLDSLDIEQVLSPPWFVPETTSLREQLNAFRERRAHFSLVVDEYGSLMGLVTLEDILEEIVGDIVDEHDIALRNTLARADGSVLIAGETTIRDLNRRFGWNFPDEEAATIAGLALQLAQQIPQVGERFELDGFILDVRGRQKNRITSVRVIPPPDAEKTPEEDT
ncbi:MAG: HlyC/CorC family transporter [Rhodospirillaceae bacterium]|jgi:Mg2+/Co2+ transporter CorB|nr:HlyC/CorC family transporter [Rhodospirillaceae bacterium]MBT5677614.1 HlyC/CorC family transporter [Rhodospirillaceae bacterium]